MNSLDAALRRYYRQISSWLPCSRGEKKEILGKIKSNISDYLEENPESDFRQVKAWFGEPEAIAAAYVDEMDTTALLYGLRVRRKLMALTTAIALAGLMIWAIGVTAIVMIEADSHPAFIEVDILREDELTEEDRTALGLE